MLPAFAMNNHWGLYMHKNNDYLRMWLYGSLFGLGLTELGTLAASAAYDGYQGGNASLITKSLSAATTGAGIISTGSLFAVASYKHFHPPVAESMVASLTTTMDNVTPNKQKQRQAMAKYIACVFAYSICSAATGQALLKFGFGVNENLTIPKVTALTASGSLALLVGLGLAALLYKLIQTTCFKDSSRRLSQATLSNLYDDSNSIFAARKESQCSHSDNSSVNSELFANDDGESEYRSSDAVSFDQDPEQGKAEQDQSCMSKWCPSFR